MFVTRNEYKKFKNKLIVTARKKYDRLEKKILSLEKELEEMKKRTVSQRTLEEDAPPTPKQILNEWINGEEKDDA